MRRPYSEDATNSTTTWPSAPRDGFGYRGPVGLRREKKGEAALVSLVEPDLAGNPQTGQRWVGRSLSRLQTALEALGHRLSRETIRQVLHANGIGAKVNVKRLVAKPHTDRDDRDRQFRYIESQRALFRRMGWPVISVDTKHKELIGCFAQAGTLWCGSAPSVYMHDFPSDAIGRAVPYGIYDVAQQRGYLRSQSSSLHQ